MNAFIFVLWLIYFQIDNLTNKCSLLIRVPYSSKVTKDDNALSPPEQRFTLLLVVVQNKFTVLHVTVGNFRFDYGYENECDYEVFIS